MTKNKQTEKSDPPSEVVSEAQTEEEQPKTAGNKKKLPINWKLVDYLVRTGLLIAMGVAFVFLLQRVLFQSKQTKSQTSPNPTGDIEEGTFATEFSKGNWSFGNSDWKFASRELSQFPSDDVLESPPSYLRRKGQWFNDQDYLDFAKAIKAKKETRGDLNVYRGEYNGIQGALITSYDGDTEIVQTVRAVLPGEQKGTFRLLEGIPNEYSQFNEKKSSRILPAMDNLTQVGFRVDNAGNISSSLLGYNGEFVDISDFWKQNGWTIEHLAGYNSTMARYLISMRDEKIVATVLKEDQGCTILLVRLNDL